MDIVQFDQMLVEQGNRCAICGGVLDKPHLDHKHGKDGYVRAILCGPCNHGIGLFQDDPERLEAAAAYLRRFEQARAVITEMQPHVLGNEVQPTWRLRLDPEHVAR
jgi:hypothetical protein